MPMYIQELMHSVGVCVFMVCVCAECATERSRDALLRRRVCGPRWVHRVHPVETSHAHIGCVWSGVPRVRVAQWHSMYIAQCGHAPQWWRHKGIRVHIEGRLRFQARLIPRARCMPRVLRASLRYFPSSHRIPAPTSRFSVLRSGD